MVSELRARFNAAFSADKYTQLVRCLNETERWPTDFRVAESPIFLTAAFTEEVSRAAHEIVQLTRTPEFVTQARGAIPAGLEVPNESSHPTFLQVDFAICSEEGKLVPRLIELQGFPSLYCFQILLFECMRSAFPAIPPHWTPYFSGLDEAAYLQLLREVIIGDARPENVVLLEIQPEKQNTRIDFACTESMLGISVVCVTEVVKRGRELFYEREGRECRIERIYNRVIFDELLRRGDLSLSFDFQDDLDVKWVGHPNWYFKVSKHSLPGLRTKYASPCYFADEFPANASLAHYVLKPLYSFAGLGVDLEPNEKKLKALPAPHDWILQKKVEYADIIPTPHGARSKAELRMMFVWPDDGEPVLANNLVRMSQGAMMGVKFNKDKTWVGSSLALHER